MRKKNILFSLALLSAVALAYGQEQRPNDDFNKAHLDLAINYMQAGQIQTAEDELQKIFTRDPKFAPAHELRGVILQRRGDLVGAESEYSLATRLDSSSASAFGNLGVVLCKTGRFEEGLASFGKALQLPKNAQISQTLVNGGICLSQKGDLAGAEKFYMKALEQEPFMPSALFQLSRVYYATQRFQLAESRLQALHKQVDPTAASLLLTYQVALAQGKTSQFKAAAQRLRTRFPNSEEAQSLPASLN